MKQLPGMAISAVLVLLALAAAGPALIRLSGALIPAVVVIAVALIAVRLVFFHTRGW